MHQVAARQQLVRGEHAVQRLAGNPHEARVARAGADEHRLEPHLLDHLLDAEQPPDQRIALEAHAELRQLLDLRVHDRIRQAEVGDAVLEHAARLVEGLVHRDVATCLGHVGGAGHAGGAGAHDADAESAGLDVRDVGPAFLDREVADPALQPPDRHGFEGLAHRADALALALLRADAAADRGQQVGGRDHVIRTPVVTLGDLLNEVRNRDVYRTTAHAGLLRAHQATLGLELRVLDEVSAVHFLEVARALLRFLLVRGRPRLRDHADGLFLFTRPVGGLHGQLGPPAVLGMLRMRQLSSNFAAASRSVAL